MDKAGLSFIVDTLADKYSYGFSWLSRPIIQYPQDVVAMQELIWAVRPDLVIETGIAHGGSLVLSASLLALIEYSEALARGEILDPSMPRRRVLGIDVDIRPHNRAAIEAHPMSNRIDMIQGSSVAPETIAQVKEHARGFERILVCLDSNHTHAHVLSELEAYAPLVSMGSYCVVFDTIIADLSNDCFPDRPWGPRDNPKTAVHEFQRRIEQEGRTGADGAPLHLEANRDIEARLRITVAPEGYLKRVASGSK